jgi:hypothetical protein
MVEASLSFKMLTFLFFQKCYMVDGKTVDMMSNSILSEMHFTYWWKHLFFQMPTFLLIQKCIWWTVYPWIYLATLFFQRCEFGDGDGEWVDDGRNNTLDMCIYYCFWITEC